MESDVLINAIGSHLDALQSTVNTSVGLALVAAWAGFQKEREISVFALKATRGQALHLLGLVFIFTNVTALILFLRLADLLYLVDAVEIDKAITAIATHKWVFNPFAQFTSTPLSIINSCFGYGALIVIWWIGYTCLALLNDNKRSFIFSMIGAVFLAVGLASMLAISHCFMVLAERLSDASAEIQAAAVMLFWPKQITSFLGIGLGGLVFALATLFASNRDHSLVDE